jgi:hypothetical protein
MQPERQPAGLGTAPITPPVTVEGRTNKHVS